jgi:hypothetical protein
MVLLPVLHAFRRDRPAQHIVDAIERIRNTARRHKIRCPACAWEPGSSARWYCVETAAPEHFSPGCGTAWNTFSTRGRCPGCSHQWHWTACLHCGGWSKHEDWYVAEDDDGPA